MRFLIKKINKEMIKYVRTHDVVSLLKELKPLGLSYLFSVIAMEIIPFEPECIEHIFTL